MHTATRAFILAGTTTLAAWAATPAFALSESELQSGKVDVQLIDHGNGKLKEVKATGLIKAPPGKVWQLLTNYGGYRSFMPRVSSSTLESRSGNSAVATMKLDLPIPFKGTWYTNRYTENPGAFTFKWNMVKGSIKHNEGSWQLKPHGSHTLAVYTVRTDPGVPLIPKWVVDTATKQTVPSIFEAIRKNVR